MPQAWGWDSPEISLLWVSYTAATAAAAKVFLLDSCPRLQTPSVSQKNYSRNWIFRVVVTGSCLSPLQSSLVPPYYSIYCSSKKKNHRNISLPLKIQNKKEKSLQKIWGERSFHNDIQSKKRETTSYRSLESYLWQNISNKLFLQIFSAVIYLF